MSHRFLFAFAPAASMGVVSTALAGTAGVKPVMVVAVTSGFRHGSIPVVEATLQSFADESEGKFAVDYTRTEEKVRSKMTAAAAAALKGDDAAMFADTTGDLPIPDRDAFIAWIRAGHGFVAAHPASDTFHGYEPYIMMLWGKFESHGPPVTVPCAVDDANHPATRAFEQPAFAVYAEIYEFANFDGGRVHGLLRTDAHPQSQGTRRIPAAVVPNRKYS